MKSPKSFDVPIYVTRPVLPDRRKVFEKIDEIWESGWLTNIGPQHEALEQRLKDYLKVSNLSLFCNGTLALQIACQALRLSGEVITTPFTFAATPHVLYWNNVKPVFCDIDEDTLNINPKKIESLITPHTTAILPVHVFGYPCDVDAIQTIADRHGLKVIYDAAHCFGIEVDGTAIGNFGDVSMFSFHATKTYHSNKGGDNIRTDNSMKERVELAKNCGFKGEESIIVPGVNAKMNELQAAIGLLMLDEFEKEVRRRESLTKVYRDRLQAIDGIRFREDIPKVRHNYHNMSVRIEDDFSVSRDKVYEEFKKYNVFTRKYFYPLCSQLQCYRHLPSASPHNLPVAEEIATQVLCLPLYGSLTKDDIHRICDILVFIREKIRG